jgi:hypothetical protein
MSRARRAAAFALVNAGKSVESCQAYILLALYGKPVRAGDEDKDWQFSGLAIRYVASFFFFDTHFPNMFG